MELLRLSLKDLIDYLFEDTLLPEVYDVLGEEKTLEFLMIFGGTKVKFPAYSKIEEFKRNIAIYETLHRSLNTATLQYLAKKYELTEYWVQSLYEAMKEEYPLIQTYLHQRKKRTLIISSHRNMRKT